MEGLGDEDDGDRILELVYASLWLRFVFLASLCKPWVHEMLTFPTQPLMGCLFSSVTVFRVPQVLRFAVACQSPMQICPPCPHAWGL